MDQIISMNSQSSAFESNFTTNQFNNGMTNGKSEEAHNASPSTDARTHKSADLANSPSIRKSNLLISPEISTAPSLPLRETYSSSSTNTTSSPSLSVSSFTTASPASTTSNSSQSALNRVSSVSSDGSLHNFLPSPSSPQSAYSTTTAASPSVLSLSSTRIAPTAEALSPSELPTFSNRSISTPLNQSSAPETTCSTSTSSSSPKTTSTSAKASVDKSTPRSSSTHDHNAGNCVFLGDLSTLATDEELHSLFAAFGEVAEVQIRRDRAAPNNLVYGFVTMESKSSAIEAKDKLAGVELHSRPLKLSWPLRNTTLFIGDLDGETTTQELRDFFRPHGEIIDEDSFVHASMRYGFVRFTSRLDAERVKTTVSRQMIGKRACRINWSDNNILKTTLHINATPELSLPLAATVANSPIANFSLLSTAPIDSSSPIASPRVGTSNFVSPVVSPSFIAGRLSSPPSAISSVPSRDPAGNTYSQILSEERLISLFSRFGAIADITTPFKLGSQQDFALISFEESIKGEQSAAAAVSTLNNCVVDGMRLRIGYGKKYVIGQALKNRTSKSRQISGLNTPSPSQTLFASISPSPSTNNFMTTGKDYPNSDGNTSAASKSISPLPSRRLKSGDPRTNANLEQYAAPTHCYSPPPYASVSATASGLHLAAQPSAQMTGEEIAMQVQQQQELHQRYFQLLHMQQFLLQQSFQQAHLPLQSPAQYLSQPESMPQMYLPQMIPFASNSPASATSPIPMQMPFLNPHVTSPATYVPMFPQSNLNLIPASPIHPMFSDAAPTPSAALNYAHPFPPRYFVPSTGQTSAHALSSLLEPVPQIHPQINFNLNPQSYAQNSAALLPQLPRSNANTLTQNISMPPFLLPANASLHSSYPTDSSYCTPPLIESNAGQSMSASSSTIPPTQRSLQNASAASSSPSST